MNPSKASGSWCILTDMLTLDTALTSLAGVGPTAASRLKRLGLATIQDLLWHLPFRYEDLTRVERIADVRGNSTVSIKGKLQLISSRRAARRKHMLVLEAIIADDSGSIKAVWFNQPFLAKILHPGDTLWLAGKVETNHFGISLMNPTWEKRDNPLNAARILPIYPLTDGLTQKQLRLWLHHALSCSTQLQETLPKAFQEKHRLLPVAGALTHLHEPTNFDDVATGRRRIGFEELLTVHLAVQQERAAMEAQPSMRIPFSQEDTVAFVQRLPFTLTPGQKRSAWDILQDMDKGAPMNRLLEGDVGSGKTVVAAIAILNVAKAGHQTAYLAPTEILARQHFEKISKLLKPFGTRVALMTQAARLLSTQEKPLTRPAMLKALADGEVDLVIGTHALIAKGIIFNNLALVIVDEQHRFGVEQRKVLRAAGSQGIPHFLSLTATPIPRTLALTVWGDLSVSRIPHLPTERKPITTTLLDNRNRDVAYATIRGRVAAGEQAFIICPRIEGDDTGVKSAKAEYEKLQTGLLATLRLGLVHGRLKSQDKEKVMAEFAKGTIDVLVATAVVEVGIDVPNATVMLIEGAESFGLAQLHQFRGRIGRSSKASTCYLTTEATDTETLERLRVLEKLNDGFALAEEDLNRRGPGELWGQLQSGFQPFKVARLTDRALVEETRAAASALLQGDPSLSTVPEIGRIVAEKRKRLHPE